MRVECATTAPRYFMRSTTSQPALSHLIESRKFLFHTCRVEVVREISRQRDWKRPEAEDEDEQG